jgi:hypothetical protein
MSINNHHTNTQQHTFSHTDTTGPIGPLLLFFFSSFCFANLLIALTALGAFVLLLMGLFEQLAGKLYLHTC